MKPAVLVSLVLALLVSSPSLRADVVRLVDESNVSCLVPCKRAAVVFIHGILGSKETWENGTTTWPELLAADGGIGDEVDVYRVEFDSYMFYAAPSIVDVLSELQDKLDDLFRLKQYSKIFLVGHSLGGNIARAYLMHVKARYGHRALSAFRVTFTLGTPMEGSSLASIVSFASRNPQLRVLLPIKVNDFQQLLNQTLLSVRSKHHDVYCPQMSLLAAYETLPMGLAGILVSRESATKYADLAQGFSRSHSTLVKPRDRLDPVYRWVTDSMASCIAGEGRCRERVTPDCGRLPEGWPDLNLEVIPRLSPASAPR